MQSIRFAHHLRRLPLFAVACAMALSGFAILRPSFASAAACTAPATDYGTVTETVSIPSTGTYYIWSRLAADNSTDNSYLLQIDSSTCFTVGGSSAKAVPVYASGATSHFANNSSNWLDTTTSGSVVKATSLSSGTHTIKMIGNSPNLVLDRIIFTQDASCTPTGTGDNCANPADTTPPVGNITAPAAGATVSATVAISVNASDDVSVTGVSIYDGSTKLGSATLSTGTGTSGTWKYNWDTSAATAGSTHTLTAKVTDGTNTTTTGSVTVTIAGGGGGGGTFKAGDINEDGVVNFLDFSALASKYGQSGSNLGRADINGDGTVNFLDFSTLASQYGQ